MKWTLSCATAVAVAAVATALTLPGDSYTPVVQAAPLHTAPVAADAYAPVRPRPVLVAQPQKTWVVRSGDTLSDIAQTRYGTQAAWTLIYWANHKQVKWANRIQVGQELYLPIPDGPLPAAPKLLEPLPPPAPPRAAVVTSSTTGSYHSTYRNHSTSTYSGSGTYSFAGLEALWINAGGPSWAASHAASIAECESGGRVNAYNPSGATGLFQILGQVVPGNLYNPYTNAANAVAKFKASGDTFAQWVCQ